MIQWEPIGGGLAVPTTASCTFTADALLLAKFAAPAPDDTVCDFGTGSGVLPLYWCRRDPPKHITAVEKEPSFAALAEEAVTKYALEERIRVLCADWADTQVLSPQSMTLVTCNPPYFAFAKGRTPADPLRAAMRHEDHPDMLASLCTAAARVLCANGRFCLCHRPERLPELFDALAKAGLTVRRLQAVQTTRTSAARLVLLEAGHGGTLKLLPPLVEHETGSATAVYHKIYDR